MPHAVLNTYHIRRVCLLQKILCSVIQTYVIFFRMISCGRDNIRLWRVKDGALRSAPVNLGEYHDSWEFTDCCFEAGLEPTKDPLDRLV